MEPKIAQFIFESWGSIGKDGTAPPFFPGPQPVSIERKHFKHFHKNEYLACEKTDGIRVAFVCIEIDGTKCCVLVNRAMQMEHVKLRSLPSRAYKGTILDGEIVFTKDNKRTLMVYDTVIVNGESLKNKNLSMRLEAIAKFTKSIMKMKTDPFVVKLKTFYSMNEIHTLIDRVKENDFEYKNDGLIFTPVAPGIKIGTHETMFKWKPKNMNTIDFRVNNRPDGTIGLYIQEKGELVFSTLLKPDQISNEWRRALGDGTIVECRFLDTTWPNRWDPIGIRTDKTYPNNRRTFNRTMVNIQEDIQIHEFVDLNKQK